MSNLKPAKSYFSKVAVARALLREKAEDILQQYLRVVDEARVSGDYETAAKSLQWLIEHMPNDDDGAPMVQVSVDKKVQAVEKGNSGPSISIGIAVGGLGPQRSLPDSELQKPRELPIVVDVDPDGR
jgi:hypothetical protein